MFAVNYIPTFPRAHFEVSVSMRRAFCLPSLAAVFLMCAGHASAQDAASFTAKIRPFLNAHCVDCHGPEVKKAGLRLDDLKLDFENPRTLALWIKANNKIAQARFLPRKRARPPQADLDQVTHG